jgi:endonuclease/exonuclease/phosphatase (EEP) superfamily protein YafD
MREYERPFSRISGCMKRWVIGMLLCLACSSVREAREPKADEPAVRILTYNLNYGMAGDQPTLEVVREADADLVLLQETSEMWEAHIRQELGEVYPYMSFRHCCLAGGLAVLSKAPYQELDYLNAPSGWFPAWRLLVETPIGPLQVLNLHLRPPVSDAGSVVSGYFTTKAIRRREIETYHAKLDASLPTLIAGDFNENDSGRALEYLRERGYRSVLPEFDDDANTWRWHTGLGTVHAELDHIVYGERLDPLNARVIEGGRSDHYPVVATFRAAPASVPIAPCTGSTSSC